MLTFQQIYQQIRGFMRNYLINLSQKFSYKKLKYDLIIKKSSQKSGLKICACILRCCGSEWIYSGSYQI
jgi:hypothetical protein